VPQYNVHEAKTNLSQLLESVERGEEVILCRYGRPVARIVPLEQPGLVLGAAKGDPNVNPQAGNDWWRAMTDDEADAFLEGR
jgi:prevent-host-death family protein